VAAIGLGARILGGWQLSGVAPVRTGAPFTVTTSATTLNAPGSSQFADRIATPHKLGDLNQWYDRSASANPSAGRFGTCRPGNVIGVGLANADLASFRRETIDSEPYDEDSGHTSPLHL